MYGLYIHVPFCRSKCDYCAFVSGTNRACESAYIDALADEIKERASGKKFDSIYIGGGTPSVLSDGSLGKILDAVFLCAEISADCEITVEANPDSCTDAFLTEVGGRVNRLSLGVQSLNDKLLKNIGRPHTAEQALAAVERIKSYGIKNVSCDLMLGLPGQTRDDAVTAAQILTDGGITHLSVYALSVEKGTPLHARGYTVDEDAAADMYESVSVFLKKCGWERYEVSNFCKPGYRSRHNFKYWTREPYIGVGVAAHSFDGKSRSYNTSDISEYIRGNRLKESYALGSGEAYEEYLMLGLRTCEGVRFEILDELFGDDWRQAKKAKLDFLGDVGIIEYFPGGFRLCEKAYFVMNEVVVRLL